MVAPFRIPRGTRRAARTTTPTDIRPRIDSALDPFLATYQPSGDEERQLVVSGVEAVLARVVEEGPSAPVADLKAYVEELIADIEDVLGNQLDEVVKSAEYLKLESAWRGVVYHHDQTGGGDLRTVLLPATRDERRADLKKKRGVIARTFGEAEYEQDGGRPFTYVVVDDEFSHAQPDVDELDRWGQLGERFHFVTHTAAAPRLFGVARWTQLPDDTEKLTEQLGGIAYARWNKFVNDPNSNSAMFVGLSCPRVLARTLFDPTAPAEGLPFFAQTVGDDDGMCWVSAAYATAARFGIALRDHGFTLGTTGKRNGGSVDGLPMAAYPLDPARSPRLPVEVMLGDKMEYFLAEKVRLIPVCGQKNSTAATVFSVNSLQVPATTKDVEESRGAQLRGSLAVVAACNRIAHHAKVIARSLIGDDVDDDDVKDEIADFLTDLSLNNHKTATRLQRLRRPLRGFDVQVEEIDNQVGYYHLKMTLMFPSKAKVIAGTFHLRAAGKKKA